MNRRLLVDSARVLRRYKGRSAIVMLATLIGTALVTVVLTLSGAAQAQVTKTIRQLFGGSSILVSARGTQFLGGPRPGAARLTIDDVAAVAAMVPAVQDWDPQQTLPSASVKAGDHVTVARVLGQSERSPRVWDRPAARGTFFDATAVRTAARVALVGETTAAALFPGQEPIGREILVESVPFTIVGVLQRFGTDLHGMDRDNEIVVPVTTLLRRVLNADTIIVARLLVSPDAKHAVDDVRQALRQRHGLPAGQPDDFTMMTPDAVQRMSGTVTSVVSLYLPLAALLVLGLSAGTTALVMLSSVKHRTAEIGLRRAVGALAGDISVQFAAETAAMTGAGGLLGVLAGYALARPVMQLWHLQHVPIGMAAVVGISLALAAGLIASVLPARRAAAIDPAVALR